MKKRAFLAVLVGFLLAFAFVATAEARLGGGQGFGGGGGGGGGGGWGGGGGGGGGGGELEILCMLVQLWIEYPIPCSILLVVGGVVYFMMNVAQNASPPRERTVVTARSLEPGRPRQTWLDRVREADANFSQPVFLDFAVLLYMRAIEARVKNKPNVVRAYMSEEAYRSLPGGAATDVCVGSARIEDVQPSGRRIALSVRFEASMTVKAPDGSARTLCSHEIWRFVKDAGVLSKSPDDDVDFSCPNCGNPEELTPAGVCRACETFVTDGRYTWSVTTINVTRRWTQRPDEVQSAGGGGQAPPTIRDANLPTERRAFMARYPGFSFDAFETYARGTFLALQDAWTTRRFEKARPYESDAIFQTHRFWIESYKRFGRTNVLRNIALDRAELVKIERDAFYDAITLRLWFRMEDFTKDDATGAVIAGREGRVTAATEYWTFVRRAGTDRSVAGADPGAQCPSCGAPVAINMAGVCQHCSAKVTSGKFGWVLSRIDQDSSYQG